MAKKLSNMKLRITVFIIITVLLGGSLIFTKSIEKALGLTETAPIITENEYNGEGSENIDIVKTGEAVIHYIDVGQGDAVMIEVPSETADTDDEGEIPGTYILIDGGSDDNSTHAAKNNNGNLKIMDYLDNTLGGLMQSLGKQPEDFVFDYVILTHQHEDHCGGLNNVLDKYPAKIVYRPNSKSTHKNGDPLIANLSKISTDKEKLWGNGATDKVTATKTYNDFLQSAYRTRFLTGDAQITKEVRVTNANDPTQNFIEGDIYYEDGIKTEIDSDDSRYFEMRFYTPTKDTYIEPNNYSPMITFDFNGKRALFTGDAETLAEKELIQKLGTLNLNVDIIKLGHHGSDTSSSEEFLKAVTIEANRSNVMTVISVGVGNSYGHPMPKILSRLSTLGFSESNILRTDINGDILLSIKYDSDTGEYVMMFGATMIRSYIPGEAPAIPVKWWHIVLVVWLIALIVIFTLRISRQGKVSVGVGSSASKNKSKGENVSRSSSNKNKSAESGYNKVVDILSDLTSGGKNTSKSANKVSSSVKKTSSSTKKASTSASKSPTTKKTSSAKTNTTAKKGTTKKK